MAPAPSASFFSLPLPSWLQPTSTRVAQYDHRKRKKSDEWSDEEGDLADTTDAASGTESVPGGQSLILTPNESHQYRIAGLSFDQELPGGDFPHGPAKEDHHRHENLPSQLFAGLSSLSSPVYPPQSPAHQGNLRLQHLSVLTAILHRCLLERDYVRAGRAWGLILREEFRGLPVDVRSEGRWGIGAEILLRRGQPEPAGNARDRSGSTPLPFTKKGFAEAQSYYERLILNHPYSKSAPHAISALHFYPAMFGLWIYVTQEESNSARKNVMDDDDSSDDMSVEEDSSVDFETRQSNKRQARIAAIRTQELEQAQQIATRMDMLLGSPPYMDSSELLELRGMVSLWIGDLLVASLVTPPDLVEDEEENMEVDIMPTDDLTGSSEKRREQRLAMEKRQVEVQKSKDFLERATRRGRSVAYNMEHLHIDDGSP
ncbi:uncharacterized protein N7459_009116 [Penicillium hispanicum]|uniref:uncharacterized protein n=1 Tax=Penicillium hispanicum TaxID=1080232 RepID=UPI00253FF66F|nr:uncharacterized protein N7459_009116 [Penicillium hispanicum]KAJ5569686.1 hypothetical protein N7459_009116 [Penicillium hispanicum]